MNVNFGNNAIVLGFSPVVIPACAGMTGFFAEWGGEGGGICRRYITSLRSSPQRRLGPITPVGLPRHT